MSIDLNSYVDVAERIGVFREKHPEGSLQPLNHDKPYAIEQIGDQTYIVVVAAAYRTPDDSCPGVGMAYEVFPGKTPYTKGSELQNAETSAWGRAIVAALAADTNRGIASMQEVRNRQEERSAAETAADEARRELLQVLQEAGVSPREATARFADLGHGSLRDTEDTDAIREVAELYRSEMESAGEETVSV